MENEKIALLAIKHRFVYDIKLNKYVWANRLVYWGDELVISGFAGRYRVSDYGKTWKLSVVEGIDQRYIAGKDFEEWREKNHVNLTKLNKKYKNAKKRTKNEKHIDFD